MSWSATTKSEAQAKARDMRLKMDHPRRWKVRVWENMGWHYALYCGNVSVYPCGFRDQEKPQYHALVSDVVREDGEFQGGGLAAWSGCPNTHKRPQRAVDVAVQRAAAYVDNLTKAIESAKQAI